jgi:type VI secretion system protein ImpK
MAEQRSTLAPFLLAGFAEFYEELAAIKLALRQGRLGAYLSVAGEAPPASGQDQALRVAGRLAQVLEGQARALAVGGAGAEVKAGRIARYAMAALADEILLLDPDLPPWIGRDAWLGVLLERRLFGTNDAGQRFFVLADQVLAASDRSALRLDLASVFLLALQLGFKGRYRGAEGAARLAEYRHRLHLVARRSAAAESALPAFPQAYEQLLVGEKEQRFAPLTRWYAPGVMAAAAYLLISTGVWWYLMHPVEQAARSENKGEVAWAHRS